ncbi:tRNA-dihydrouridine(16/17) synthase [NAD(P)(+)]-like [Dissostichus eleginoides]|uniref:tRNA-dihydrouridine(16/17) synthase [NAD(P)(+)]-like n=1 Tax=Dissostichus eleginoides TaxID=100907 RepID=A0AAD9B4I5_DISEL|nr:tRNA-dihydrouridine(16/17) synthase [NAD(P)(+)]-like [Dissostichus eleginoides]
MAKMKTVEGLADVSKQLKLRCQEEIANGKGAEEKKSSLPFPHWICQPYIRPEPVPYGNKRGPEVMKAMCQKRALEDSDGTADQLSKNKQKKKSRNPNKNFCVEQKPKYVKCEQCGNPKGNKCVFNLCRACCKKKAYKEVADCPSHGLRFKTKAEKQKAEENGKVNGEERKEETREETRRRRGRDEGGDKGRKEEWQRHRKRDQLFSSASHKASGSATLNKTLYLYISMCTLSGHMSDPLLRLSQIRSYISMSKRLTNIWSHQSPDVLHSKALL